MRSRSEGDVFSPIVGRNGILEVVSQLEREA